MSPTETLERAWPDERPELLPFLPLVASIWADGALTESEVTAFLDGLDGIRALGPGSRADLAPWLDPDDPPTPLEVAVLEERIRRADLDDEADATRSLAALGFALHAVADSGSRTDDATTDVWASEASRQELHALEDALGLLGGEAARRLRNRAIAAPQRPRPPSLDTGALHAYLDRDRLDLRRRVTDLLLRPEFRFEPGIALDEYRERVLAAVQLLADEGLGSLAYPGDHGGQDDPAGAVAAFESVAFGDLSVLVKFGVQFGLFGGSVHQLGTHRHHDAYLERIASLDLPGCYAMTETGHGSNVRDLETTATYDHDTRELVIHTPHERAGKDWIGNAGVHGRMATVFTRLVVSGVDHGVHAVLVPIRTDQGAPARGVRIEDRGLKAGLNGVDNGRLWFDRVRVPVDNLLDRFATIDEQGGYHSPIPSAGRRFFTMLGTLVAGRVSVASAAVSASKSALTIAVRYASERKQFGPDGSEERPILDYLALQRTLAPRLATTIGLHFAVRALQRRFAEAEGSDGELEAFAAGLKAYASDHCLETIQASREACGGQGYLAENRFAALHDDADIFTTFEGANLVLHQLAAKGLLSRFREEMGGFGLRKAIRYLTDRAETSVTELNPVVTRRTEEAHLLDLDFHQAALAYREQRLLRSVALRMRARLRDGMESFDAVNEVQDHLVAVSRAHVERVIADHFRRGVSDAPSPGMSELLQTAAALYGLSRIEADAGWFLEAGYLEPIKSRAIRSQVNALCREVSGCGVELVDGFGIPDGLLPEIGRSPSAK